MTRYYVPMRCPNCGDASMTETPNPLAQSGDPLHMRHAMVVKWAECNMCGEIYPLPRNIKEYHS